MKRVTVCWTMDTCKRKEQRTCSQICRWSYHPSPRRRSTWRAEEWRNRSRWSHTVLQTNKQTKTPPNKDKPVRTVHSWKSEWGIKLQYLAAIWMTLLFLKEIFSQAYSVELNHRKGNDNPGPAGLTCQSEQDEGSAWPHLMSHMARHRHHALLVSLSPVWLHCALQHDGSCLWMVSSHSELSLKDTE